MKRGDVTERGSMPGVGRNAKRVGGSECDQLDLGVGTCVELCLASGRAGTPLGHPWEHAAMMTARDGAARKAQRRRHWFVVVGHSCERSSKAPVV